MIGEVLIHIAAQAIEIGPQLRQRCGWCGAVLIDEDQSKIMVLSSEADRSYPTWPTGALVGHDGAVSWLVDHIDGDSVPVDCCANLPHDITGHRLGPAS